MITHRTGKYDYNALCDVCGFKFKASQLIKRWDGLMVCEDDWEPRNILDFYRTRSDAHQLAFTRPEDAGENTWAIVPANFTGSYTSQATYIVSVDNIVTYKIVITPTSGTVSGASATLALPIGTVSVDKKGNAITSAGTRIGQVTATTKLNIPNFSITASPLVTLMISGSYIKA